MEIDDIKHTVTAIIINDKNQVLAVSRKDDHNDFGLPGGKVDPEDFISDGKSLSPLEKAIVREVYEETGLNINAGTMVELLSMPRHMIGKAYWGHSYLIRDWSGEIDTDEPHVVKWTSFEELENGCFGTWNTIAKDCLKAIGIDIK